MMMSTVVRRRGALDRLTPERLTRVLVKRGRVNGIFVAGQEITEGNQYVPVKSEEDSVIS